MSKLRAKLAKIKEDQIILQTTRTIREEDLKFPEWFELQGDYEAMSDGSPVDKIIVSLKNSIIAQRRVVFALSREKLSALVKADANWSSAAGFDNNNYKVVRKIITEDLKWVRCIEMGSNRNLTVFEVIDSDLLEYLQVDVQKQITQTMDFVRRTKSDAKPDRLSDTVISKELIDNKELVVSKQKVESESNLLDKQSSSGWTDKSSKLLETKTELTINPKHSDKETPQFRFTPLSGKFDNQLALAKTHLSDWYYKQALDHVEHSDSLPSWFDYQLNQAMKAKIVNR